MIFLGSKGLVRLGKNIGLVIIIHFKKPCINRKLQFSITIMMYFGQDGKVFVWYLGRDTTVFTRYLAWDGTDCNLAEMENSKTLKKTAISSVPADSPHKKLFRPGQVTLENCFVPTNMLRNISLDYPFK